MLILRVNNIIKEIILNYLILVFGINDFFHFSDKEETNVRQKNQAKNYQQV